MQPPTSPEHIYEYATNELLDLRKLLATDERYIKFIDITFDSIHNNTASGNSILIAIGLCRIRVQEINKGS